MTDALTFHGSLIDGDPPESRGMDRSTIEFPYLDLESAVEVSKAVYGRAGLGLCEMDELAAQMNQTISGSFRLKTATAKTFGLVEKEGRSAFRLSPLGRRLVQAEGEAEARATAFLTVPLYKAVYDRYRGHLLPPTRALEREMAGFGVAPKQADRARQAFERSARQAGFFAQGEDRLVQPRFERGTEGIQSVAPDGTGRPHGVRDATANDSNESSGGLVRVAGNGGTKPLEYQLIDLLKGADIGDPERSAVWTLVQFLAARRDA